MREPIGRTPSRAPTTRKPREERWAEIVKVATDVFFEQGYEAASLQDIAGRMGMLKGSLYYYISSKEDLLYDVLSDVHEKGLAVIYSLAAVDGDPLDKLDSVIAGHVAYSCQNIERTAVFLHEIEALPAPRRREILGADHAYQGVFRNLVLDAEAAGLLRTGVDPKIATMSILGSMNWAYRWFRPAAGYPPAEIGRQLADLSISAIATPEVMAGRRASVSRRPATP